MRYAKYKCCHRAHINGHLYLPGDVVEYIPEIEDRKSFKGLGEPVKRKKKEEE